MQNKKRNTISWKRIFYAIVLLCLVRIPFSSVRDVVHFTGDESLPKNLALHALSSYDPIRSFAETIGAKIELEQDIVTAAVALHGRNSLGPFAQTVVDHINQVLEESLDHKGELRLDVAKHSFVIEGKKRKEEKKEYKKVIQPLYTVPPAQSTREQIDAFIMRLKHAPLEDTLSPSIIVDLVRVFPFFTDIAYTKPGKEIHVYQVINYFLHLIQGDIDFFIANLQLSDTERLLWEKNNWFQLYRDRLLFVKSIYDGLSLEKQNRLLLFIIVHDIGYVDYTKATYHAYYGNSVVERWARDHGFSPDEVVLFSRLLAHHGDLGMLRTGETNPSFWGQLSSEEKQFILPMAVCDIAGATITHPGMSDIATIEVKNARSKNILGINLLNEILSFYDPIKFPHSIQGKPFWLFRLERLARVKMGGVLLSPEMVQELAREYERQIMPEDRELFQHILNERLWCHTILLMIRTGKGGPDFSRYIKMWKIAAYAAKAFGEYATADQEYLVDDDVDLFAMPVEQSRLLIEQFHKRLDKVPDTFTYEEFLQEINTHENHSVFGVPVLIDSHQIMFRLRLFYTPTELEALFPFIMNAIKLQQDVVHDPMKSRVILGLGISATGKSTTSKVLAQRYQKDCIVLSLDNYYLSRDQKADSEMPKNAQGEIDYDSPESFDIEGLLHDIQCLVDGETVTVRKYDFSTRTTRADSTVALRPDQLILLEGIPTLQAVLKTKLAETLGATIYFTAPESECIVRRMKRDYDERGLKPERIIKRVAAQRPLWKKRQHELYQDADRSDAFLCISRGDDDVVREMTRYVRQAYLDFYALTNQAAQFLRDEIVFMTERIHEFRSAQQHMESQRMIFGNPVAFSGTKSLYVNYDVDKEGYKIKSYLSPLCAPQVITIQGPAATGKSTLARNVAKGVNGFNMSVGLVYRAISYLALKANDDSDQYMVSCLDMITLENAPNHDCIVYYKGHDITAEIESRRIDIEQRMSEGFSDFVHNKVAQLWVQKLRQEITYRQVVIDLRPGTVKKRLRDSTVKRLDLVITVEIAERARRSLHRLRNANNNDDRIVYQKVFNQPIPESLQTSPKKCEVALLDALEKQLRIRDEREMRSQEKEEHLVYIDATYLSPEEIAHAGVQAVSRYRQLMDMQTYFATGMTRELVHSYCMARIGPYKDDVLQKWTAYDVERFVSACTKDYSVFVSFLHISQREKSRRLYQLKKYAYDVLYELLGDAALKQQTFIRLLESDGYLSTKGKTWEVIEHEVSQLLFGNSEPVLTPVQYKELFTDTYIPGAFEYWERVLPGYTTWYAKQIKKRVLFQFEHEGLLTSSSSTIGEKIDAYTKALKEYYCYNTKEMPLYAVTPQIGKIGLLRLIHLVALGTPVFERNVLERNLVANQAAKKIAQKSLIPLLEHITEVQSLEALEAIRAVITTIVQTGTTFIVQNQFKPNEVQRIEQEVFQLDQKRKSHSLVLDSVETYVRDHLRGDPVKTVAYFPDDNGDVVFHLLWIQKQLELNRNLRVVVIPKNGQFDVDVSYHDLELFLEDDAESGDCMFAQLQQYRHDGRFAISKDGPRLAGFNGKEISSALAELLRDVSTIVGIGSSMMECLNGIKKDVYIGLVSYYMPSLTLLGTEKNDLVFCRIPAAVPAFQNVKEGNALYTLFDDRGKRSYTATYAGQTVTDCLRALATENYQSAFDMLNASPDNEADRVRVNEWIARNANERGVTFAYFVNHMDSYTYRGLIHLLMRDFVREYRADNKRFVLLSSKVAALLEDGLRGKGIVSAEAFSRYLQVLAVSNPGLKIYVQKEGDAFFPLLARVLPVQFTAVDRSLAESIEEVCFEMERNGYDVNDLRVISAHYESEDAQGKGIFFSITDSRDEFMKGIIEVLLPLACIWNQDAIGGLRQNNNVLSPSGGSIVKINLDVLLSYAEIYGENTTEGFAKRFLQGLVTYVDNDRKENIRRYESVLRNTWQGLMLDVDETLTERLNGSVPDSIVVQLVQLAKKNVPIGLCTGRVDRELFNTLLRKILHYEQDEAVLRNFYIYPCFGAFGYRLDQRNINESSDYEDFPSTVRTFYENILPVDVKIDLERYITSEILPRLPHIPGFAIKKNFNQRGKLFFWYAPLEGTSAHNELLITAKGFLEEQRETVMKYCKSKGYDVSCMVGRRTFEIYVAGTNKKRAFNDFAARTGTKSEQIAVLGDSGKGADKDMFITPASLCVRDCDKTSSTQIDIPLLLHKTKAHAAHDVLSKLTMEPSYEYQKMLLREDGYVSLVDLREQGITVFEYIQRDTQKLFNLYFRLTEIFLSDYQQGIWRGLYLTPDSIWISSYGDIKIKTEQYATLDTLLEQSYDEHLDFRALLRKETVNEVKRWGEINRMLLLGFDRECARTLRDAVLQIKHAGIYSDLAEPQDVLKKTASIFLRLSSDFNNTGAYPVYRTPYFYFQDLIGLYEMYQTSKNHNSTKRRITWRNALPEESYGKLAALINEQHGEGNWINYITTFLSQGETVWISMGQGGMVFEYVYEAGLQTFRVRTREEEQLAPLLRAAHKGNHNEIEMLLPVSCGSTTRWVSVGDAVVAEYVWDDTKGIFRQAEKQEEYIGPQIRKKHSTRSLEGLLSIRSGETSRLVSYGNKGSCFEYVWDQTKRAFYVVPPEQEILAGAVRDAHGEFEVNTIVPFVHTTVPRVLSVGEKGTVCEYEWNNEAKKYARVPEPKEILAGAVRSGHHGEWIESVFVCEQGLFPVWSSVGGSGIVCEYEWDSSLERYRIRAADDEYSAGPIREACKGKERGEWICQYYREHTDGDEGAITVGWRAHGYVRAMEKRSDGIVKKSEPLAEQYDIRTVLEHDVRLYDGELRPMIEGALGKSYSLAEKQKLSMTETSEEDIPSHLLPLVRYVRDHETDAVVSLSKNGEIIGYGLHELMKVLQEKGVVSFSKIPDFQSIIVAKEKEIPLGQLLLGVLTQSERERMMDFEQKKTLMRMYKKIKKIHKEVFIDNLMLAPCMVQISRENAFSHLLNQSYETVIETLAFAFSNRARQLKAAFSFSQDMKLWDAAYMLNILFQQTAVWQYYQAHPSILVIDDLMATGSTLASAQMVFESIDTTLQVRFATLLFWPRWMSFNDVVKKYGITPVTWGKYAAGKNNLRWIYYYALISPEWKSAVNYTDTERRARNQKERVLDGDAFETSYFGEQLRKEIYEEIKRSGVPITWSEQEIYDAIAYYARKTLTDQSAWAKYPLPWKQDEQKQLIDRQCIQDTDRHLNCCIEEATEKVIKRMIKADHTTWKQHYLRESYLLVQRIKASVNQLMTNPQLNTLLKTYFALPEDDRITEEGLKGNAILLHEFIMWASMQYREPSVPIHDSINEFSEFPREEIIFLKSA